MSGRATAAGAVASQHLSPGRHLAVNFLWLGLNFQYAAFLPVVVPAQITLFVTPGSSGSAPQAVFLGVLSAAGSLVALVVEPVAGWLSDSSRSRHGRRRPYLLAGFVVMAVGMLMLAGAPGLAIFTVGFLLVELGSNAATAAYQGVIPDYVPPEQRGEASGYYGAMNMLGSALSLAFAAVALARSSPHLDASIRFGAAWFYAAATLLLLVGVIVTMGAVREVPLAVEQRPFTGRVFSARLWLEPWRHGPFVWVFLARASLMLGLTLFLTFIEYYFAQVAQTPDFIVSTAGIALLALVAAVGGAVASGILSDRIGRVPLVFFASMCMAAAAFAFVVSGKGVPLWPLGLAFGLGLGAYTSVDWALAIDALPSLQSAAKDLGLWNIATNLPAAVAPVLGSGVIALAAVRGALAMGYRSVFALATLFLLLGAALILQVPARPQLGDTAFRAPLSRFGRFLLGFGSAGGGRAVGTLTAWTVYERLSRWAARVEPVSPGGVFAFRLERHRGREVTLADGTRILPGDRLVDLHLDNRRLAALTRAGGSPFQLAPAARADLRALAGRLATPELADVRAVHGVTLLQPAARRLGFETRTLPRSWRWALTRFFFVGLLRIYRPRVAPEGGAGGRWPVEIWLSRRGLLERYG